jgi:hypothetical protein
VNGPARYRFPEQRPNPPTALVDDALSQIDWRVARVLDLIDNDDVTVGTYGLGLLLEVQQVIDRLRGELRQ